MYSRHIAPSSHLFFTCRRGRKESVTGGASVRGKLGPGRPSIPGKPGGPGGPTGPGGTTRPGGPGGPGGPWGPDVSKSVLPRPSSIASLSIRVGTPATMV